MKTTLQAFPLDSDKMYDFSLINAPEAKEEAFCIKQRFAANDQINLYRLDSHMLQFFKRSSLRYENIYRCQYTPHG
jgi:hypothetical protein